MSTQRVPIAFVDLSGYITPYNGRITDGLPGKYLYTKEEVEYYYNKQVAADQEKDIQRYGGEVPQVPPPPAPAMSVPPPPRVTMSAPPLSAVEEPSYIPEPPPVSAVRGEQVVINGAPPLPPNAVAIPAPPPGSEPGTLKNLTPEEMDKLKPGIDPNAAARQVFSKAG